MYFTKYHEGDHIMEDQMAGLVPRVGEVRNS